ncbi:MAG: hypothetical protein K2K45_02320 [Muribaculaceae bacterium]|nr:hypothetical protein [Muribaculaceae bacterium]
MELTIHGDDGEWSAPVTRKGLSRIYVKVIYNDRKYLTYRNKDYKITDEHCTASDLLDIEYDNPISKYIISYTGDMLYIHSIYNASDNKHMVLVLEYDYGTTKYIDVTFSKGIPLRLEHQEMDQNMKIEENIETIPHSFSFSNNSSATQHVNITPFAESSSTCKISAADEWATDFEISGVMIPSYYEGWDYTELTDCIIGESFSFKSESLMTEVFPVFVPPHKKATVKYNVNYSRATVKSTLILYNTVDHFEIRLPVTCSCVNPTSYDYEVIFEDI